MERNEQKMNYKQGYQIGLGMLAVDAVIGYSVATNQWLAGGLDVRPMFHVPFVIIGLTFAVSAAIAHREYRQDSDII